MVIGGALGISINIFQPGQTLAGQIAGQFTSSTSALFTASLLYLALILLVFSIVVNLVAQFIVRRSARHVGSAR
jgi:phosphate transport system permease protein